MVSGHASSDELRIQKGGAVDADRREHLSAAIAVQDAPDTRLREICDMCAHELGVTGARLRMLTTASEHSGGGLLCSSDTLGVRLEALAITAGIAPSIDAFESGWPVLVPDLNTCGDRWPRFTADAIAAGVLAIFAFPLHTNEVRLGVLELHRDSTGSLTMRQLTDALFLAATATATIVRNLNAAAPTPLSHIVDIHDEVHQATGMVAARLKVNVRDALSRIREHALAHRKTLTEVADDIVERRLHLD